VFEVFLYSPWETLPILHTVGSWLGDRWKKTVMSCQFNHDQADKGTRGRNSILRSEDLVRKLPHSSWRLEGEGPSGSGNMVWPIRKDLVVMSEWAHCSWNLESPEAAPAWPFYYGSPVSQTGRSWREVPLSCVEDFSVKWALGKHGRSRRSTWVTEHFRIGEFHSSQLF
jgi:hypothetical protein